MVVNAAQLASYSQAKQAILGTGYIQVGSVFSIRSAWHSIGIPWKEFTWENSFVCWNHLLEYFRHPSHVAIHYRYCRAVRPRWFFFTRVMYVIFPLKVLTPRGNFEFLLLCQNFHLLCLSKVVLCRVLCMQKSIFIKLLAESCQASAGNNFFIFLA